MLPQQYTRILLAMLVLYLCLLLPKALAHEKANRDVQISHRNRKPDLQHAKIYKKVQHIEKYWTSEKLDGVRGYWNGEQLLTRNGNVLPAPNWFVENWPNITMDGELWSARGEFEKISACVRTKTSNGECWRDLKLMIFDLPLQKSNFSQRILLMKQLAQNTKSPYLQMVEQRKVYSSDNLYTWLDKVVENEGEGLMLHLATAHHQTGRSNNLLKLKKHQDAEAIVIAHVPGKGKYQGMLGAIKVKTPQGIIFKIGSGFSDHERQNPPKIGAIITYKYIGKTRRGVPRFASFLRIKKVH